MTTAESAPSTPHGQSSRESIRAATDQLAQARRGLEVGIVYVGQRFPDFLFDLLCARVVLERIWKTFGMDD